MPPAISFDLSAPCRGKSAYSGRRPAQARDPENGAADYSRSIAERNEIANRPPEYAVDDRISSGGISRSATSRFANTAS